MNHGLEARATLAALTCVLLPRITLTLSHVGAGCPVDYTGWKPVPLWGVCYFRAAASAPHYAQFIMEIFSPRTTRKDLRDKLHAYEQAGIPEYWVIYPSEQVINVFSRDAQGQYGAPAVYVSGGQAPVGVLPGLVIDLEQVFAANF